MVVDAAFFFAILSIIVTFNLVNIAFVSSTYFRKSFFFVLLSSLSFLFQVVIYLLHESVPPVIGISVSNLMFVNTLAFVGIAHHLILEESFPTVFYATTLTATLAVFLFEGIVPTPYHVRAMVTMAAVLIIMGKHALLVLRDFRRIGLPIASVLVLAFFFVLLLAATYVSNALQERMDTRYVVGSGVFPFLIVLLTSIFVMIQSSSYILFSRIKYLEAYEALEKAAEERDFSRTILFMTGHDVRGPIATAFEAVELLDESGVPTSGSLSDLVRVSIHKAFYILDDLLLWSREWTGTLTLKTDTLNLAYIVDSLTAQAAPDMGSKGLVLEKDVSDRLFVSADKTALNAVIRNIIGNAVKFSRRGGKILVSSLPGEVEGEVRLLVRDFGIGMSEENLERFRDGASQESRLGTKSEKGLGLGLMLISNICRTAGWKFEIDSRSGEGTSVILGLPAARIPAFDG